jgi:phage shock protein PspC (stress-responsive transcriptional regulator)
MNEVKKLYRSRENQMIGGVCGGIGEFLNIDPTIVRLCFAALALVGYGIIGYIAALIIIPEAPKENGGDSKED